MWHDHLFCISPPLKKGADIEPHLTLVIQMSQFFQEILHYIVFQLSVHLESQYRGVKQGYVFRLLHSALNINANCHSTVVF